MLYGHKEVVDNRVATLVSSADTIEEYDAFLVRVREQEANKRNYVEMYTSHAVQHLTDPMLRGFKKLVHVFYHQPESDASDEARSAAEKQQEAFAAEWGIKVLPNGVQSRDKQEDMLIERAKRDELAAKERRTLAQQLAEEAGIPYNGERELTLGEMYGLDEYDPWDRRSEEEKQYDIEMREMARKAKAAGNMSSDSFDAPETKSPAVPPQQAQPAQPANRAPKSVPNVPPSSSNLTNPNDILSDLDRLISSVSNNPAPAHANSANEVHGTDEAPVETDNKGKLQITDTDAILRADGSLDITKIVARKTGGPVDENLKKFREEEYERKKKELLGDKPGFTPEDFAAVLAGDGSADSIGMRGNRTPLRGGEAPERAGLSETAKAARDALNELEKEAMRRTQEESEEKAKADRFSGKFTGCDLFPEDQEEWEDLDDALVTELQRLGISEVSGDKIGVKEYPYESMLGDTCLLPFDHYGSRPDASGDKAVTAIISTVNVDVKGIVNMGETAVAVVERADKQKPGYVVYGRAGGRLGSKVLISVVKIRQD